MWQGNLHYFVGNGSVFQTLLQNYEGMKSEQQLKAAPGLITMGNHLDTVLEFEAQGLETADKGAG